MAKTVSKKNKKTKAVRVLDSLSWLLGPDSVLSEGLSLRLREGMMLLLLVVAGYLTLSLYSYSSTDPGWSFVGTTDIISNYGGRAGAWLADVFFSLFGAMAWLFPFAAVIKAIRVYLYRYQPWEWLPALILVRSSGFFLLLIAAAALASLHYHYLGTDFSSGIGGIMGTLVVEKSLPVFSLIGSTLLLMASLVVGITLYIDFSWFRLMDLMGRVGLVLIKRGRLLSKEALHYFSVLVTQCRERWVAFKQQQVRKKKESLASLEPVQREPVQVLPVVIPEHPPVQPSVPETRDMFVPVINKTPPQEVGALPEVGLLDKARGHEGAINQAYLDAVSRQVELKLKDFGVEVQVVAAHPGPVITRYEIQPAPGVKASRITNLASDLARSLAVVSVRVVEVIPGKSVMGVEIPNDNRETVFFSELIASSTYKKATSALSLALGHDISGQPVVVDLAKMPHLLVAGTTGSGKSVGVNAMLLSMLFKSGPESVRLIMIDPKMLELSIYDGIPHLLAPVVTDMKEAANALRWCVAEMERRYKLMAALGVRNITGFNDKVAKALEAGEPLPDPLYQPVAAEDIPPPLNTLPFIVVVIDEFADMMMIVGKKVEELIARIAQKARAAGIHLILATQRPSVDVITGLIKANVPTRISFQVSGKIDSRTIIDQGGAEQLLGHGDMLYLPPGTSVPIRVHGAFVSDDEVHRVVADWKQRGQPDYVEEVLNGMSESAAEGSALSGGLDGDSERDPLYDEAVAFVTETRKASISSVQRKLKIGYNRAARMIESMEMAGVVSPMGTNGNREVMAPAPPKN